ncbi:MAG: thiamine pyrophosphate-binding protein [Lachnospiraceae bacterium]|nr:thiamine pyrophosphate-binding protein [Lachnospiraceae bacterium]
MKVSDYIVDFLIQKEIKDVFGYPGGMVTHLMDSFRKREPEIHAHVNYHEQGAAFAACGYAQASGKMGVAYATSGPGATNLITGICNAWFDSIPVLFITGQVNTFEAKGGLAVRQRGFQETDILAMVNGITKYCAYVSRPEDIGWELTKAWYCANEGRKGPVLLDIPMDVQRAEVPPEKLKLVQVSGEAYQEEEKWDELKTLLKEAKKPVILAGAGIKTAGAQQLLKEFAEIRNMPVVSSMPAFDILGRDHSNYYGFIGAYGDRAANFIVAKSDLILSLGSRLDVRQIGARTERFGENAKLIRVDIDKGEFSRKVKADELELLCDVKEFLKMALEINLPMQGMQEWLTVCNTIRDALKDLDASAPKEIIGKFSKKLPEEVLVTTDVGQNQVWVAQAFCVKQGQKVFFSGGHGAMGYSLPAAIGAYYGSKKPVISFNGDGGIQMNIQELQFIAREQLPITVVILNNSSLGMIRHFQEMYFQENYVQTNRDSGYTVPDFGKIANAYGIAYRSICREEDMEAYSWDADKPCVVEICLEDRTYVFPKLEFGKPNQDQEPLIDRSLYDKLMKL